jgi:3-oxoacyl-[acyl-carrier protein] reductase
VPSNGPDRVALITGARGGLGQSLVAEFVAEGWHVVAALRGRWTRGRARSRIKIKSKTSPWREGEGKVGGLTDNNPWELDLDVTNRKQIHAVVTEILDRWHRIDVLINNAGVISDAPLAHMGDSEWDDVLSVNLKGAFLCSQAVLRPMLRQRNGHIINISSFSGRVGARGQANYAAAKAGLFGLTTSLAHEVGSRNIRVNAVLPGVLPTRMTSHLPQAQMNVFAQANALGRINSVEEVARFVAFLATTENISGQLFQLDSRIAPWT